MFTPFLTVLLHELTQFLVANKDFFERSEAARVEAVSGLKIPNGFRLYLAAISAEAFMSDVRLVLSFMNGARLADLPVRENAFFVALVDFFTGPFASKIDELPCRFYLLSYEARAQEIHKIVESENAIADALRDLLVSNSYQEIATEMEALTKAVHGAETVLVQAPRDIAVELKKEMRQKLLKKYPHAFPVFQVNRGLIGGFRVFVDGQTTDHSWFSRIVKLSSLKHV